MFQVVTSGEDAESGVEETSSNTVSVCHESTPTKEPQTKRRKVEEDGDGSYLRQLPALVCHCLIVQYRTMHISSSYPNVACYFCYFGGAFTNRPVTTGRW